MSSSSAPRRLTGDRFSTTIAFPTNRPAHRAPYPAPDQYASASRHAALRLPWRSWHAADANSVEKSLAICERRSLSSTTPSASPGAPPPDPGCRERQYSQISQRLLAVGRSVPTSRGLVIKTRAPRNRGPIYFQGGTGREARATPTPSRAPSSSDAFQLKCIANAMTVDVGNYFQVGALRLGRSTRKELGAPAAAGRAQYPTPARYVR